MTLYAIVDLHVDSNHSLSNLKTIPVPQYFTETAVRTRNPSVAQVIVFLPWNGLTCIVFVMGRLSIPISRHFLKFTQCSICAKLINCYHVWVFVQ